MFPPVATAVLVFADLTTYRSVLPYLVLAVLVLLFVGLIRPTVLFYSRQITWSENFLLATPFLALWIVCLSARFLILAALAR
jgi:hypothetical protein